MPDYLRRVVVLFVLAVLTSTLPATWSIIIVDTRTGEIAIGSATCLTGFDLQLGASVVVVGRGAAAAQSFIDTTGQNRQLIFTQLALGTDPVQILAMLAASDPGHQTRQYGIVDTQGRAVGFTGTGDGQWAGNLTGQIGTLAYAIQGNVLTGNPVITAAEQALRTTPGDLAEKLMAAMEAARSMGGDGRCSCSQSAPNSCGSPPPSFTHSAQIGYMLVARPGDFDGVCNPTVGCASGSYYMDLNFANAIGTEPDPVFILRTMFLDFRLNKILRPDHFLSAVSLDPATLLADGTTRTTAHVVLNDWRGVRIPYGGAIVQVTADPSGTAPVTLGAVTDQGDGSYSFPITAGTQVGTARLKIVVDDGLGAVQLGPLTAVQVTNDRLWLDHGNIEAAAGGNLAFTLNAGSAQGNRFYLLLGSASGSTPGLQLGPGLTLPLNPDPVFFITLNAAGSGALPGFFAALDAQGRRISQLAVPPGMLQFLQNGRLTFAYGLLNPIDFVSNPVTLDVR